MVLTLAVWPGERIERVEITAPGGRVTADVARPARQPGRAGKILTGSQSGGRALTPLVHDAGRLR